VELICLWFFTTSNGTRQGGILSPFLFCHYIRDLLHDIAQAGIGCNIGGVFINILAYADDMSHCFTCTILEGKARFTCYT